MSFFALILAQGESGAEDADALHSRLITFAAYAAVIALALFWTLFIRKQRNKRRRIPRRKPHTWQLSGEERVHRHHHHRRPKGPELPKNPSRAEAGGLPPRRPDDPLPPDT